MTKPPPARRRRSPQPRCSRWAAARLARRTSRRQSRFKGRRATAAPTASALPLHASPLTVADARCYLAPRTQRTMGRGGRTGRPRNALQDDPASRSRPWAVEAAALENSRSLFRAAFRQHAREPMTTLVSSPLRPERGWTSQSPEAAARRASEHAFLDCADKETVTLCRSICGATARSPLRLRGRSGSQARRRRGGPRCLGHRVAQATASAAAARTALRKLFMQADRTLPIRVDGPT